MGLSKEEVESMQERLRDFQERLGIDDTCENSENGRKNEKDKNEVVPEKLTELLKNNDPAASGNGILDAFSSILKNGTAQETKILEPQKEIDTKSYFSDNMLKEELSLEDIITVSHKDGDGYKAVFVTIGDIVKFIKNNLDK